MEHRSEPAKGCVLVLALYFLAGFCLLLWLAWKWGWV